MKKKVFLMNDQFLLDFPYEKYQKGENVKHLILKNVQDFFNTLFYLRNKIYLFQILRDLLSSKNRILDPTIV